MRYMMILNRAALLSGVIVCAGCSSRSMTSSVELLPTQPEAAIVVVETAPGVVKQTWEEPMVDVVKVPPGLDPEGHYYRPAHESIVEIRQGRWIYRGDQ